MAPEYAMNFSVKTDVFRFGVLVLEIITGKKKVGLQMNKAHYSSLANGWKCWREEKGLNIVDPCLIETSGLSDEFMKCIHIGLLCVQEHAQSRPTIASVNLMLNANSFTLLRPLKPAFHSEDGESLPRGNHTATLNDVTITELDPR